MIKFTDAQKRFIASQQLKPYVKRPQIYSDVYPERKISPELYYQIVGGIYRNIERVYPQFDSSNVLSTTKQGMKGVEA